MAETVCAEIIYYRERAGLAREKADAATMPETKTPLANGVFGCAAAAMTHPGSRTCSRKNEPTVTISGKQWRAQVPNRGWAWGRAKGDETMKIASTLSVAF
jgi:hypothetical protein